jgi:hypothetical protein
LRNFFTSSDAWISVLNLPNIISPIFDVFIGTFLRV